MFSHKLKNMEKRKFTAQKPFWEQMIEKILRLDFDFGSNDAKILRLSEFSSKKKSRKFWIFFSISIFGGFCLEWKFSVQKSSIVQMIEKSSVSILILDRMITKTYIYENFSPNKIAKNLKKKFFLQFLRVLLGRKFS